MKHAFWFLLAMFAVAGTAQQSDTAPVRSQLALAAAPISSITETDGTQTGTAAPAPKPAAKQKTKPKDTKVTETKWPTVESSMVGYIDNAIVGTEVRVRFDAAFNDAFPDRAEFIYGKCGCYRSLPLSDPNYDPNAPGPGSGKPDQVNFQALSFMGEYAPRGRGRFSAFFEIPIRWVQPQGSFVGTQYFSAGGIGDVIGGLKFALLASQRRYLTAQLKSYFPSGDARRGLGTHHYSVEPSLLYYQRISDRFEIEGEVGGWLPTSGSAGAPTNSSQKFSGNVFFYGIGPSYRVIDHEQFKLAPVIELVGWTVTGGFQTGGKDAPQPASADGTNIVNMKLGARMAFREHNSVYVGYGRALTSADWYNDILRVEYRYSF